MRVVLAGGGTGGHIYPAISVGQALLRADPEAELLFVGSSHGPERDIARSAGIAFEGVPSSPLTPSLSAKGIVSVARLWIGVVRARRILGRFGADVVFATGGYAAAAAAVAQITRAGRLVIHEQNAVPGRTNLWLAARADKVCIAAQRAASFFPADRTVFTGMPIREEFARLPQKQEARRALGLDEDRFTVVVVGGSQGARRVNELVLNAWPLIDDGSTQVLHQVGRLNLAEVQSRLPGGPQDAYRVEPYLDMPSALAAADLVIARSGASTLAEIAAAGVPSILIPYPHAHADHQTANAACFAETNAAILFREDELAPEQLAEAVADLRADPARLRRMAEASKSLSVPDAAARAAAVVVSVV